MEGEGGEDEEGGKMRKGEGGEDEEGGKMRKGGR